MSDTDRNPFEHRLANLDKDDPMAESIRCQYCDEEHWGELQESHPEGWYIKYYCTNRERTGRVSYI